jgi:Superfamily I DNA and RNA helicases and helicase subunits
MKLHLDLSMVEARPARWAALLGGGVGSGGASKAAELARVMGYLAREFSTVRRTVMWRRETKESGGRARYALRPFASIRTPGPLDGRWLALVCEYNEATRALVVVDREAVDSGPLGAREKIFSGEIGYMQGRVSAGYCDGEAVAFLRVLPAAPGSAGEGREAGAEGAGTNPMFTRWREYLDWRRRVAEAKADASHAYIECDARDPRAVKFYLADTEGGPAEAERLRRRWRDEELRVGEDPKDTRAPQGLFRRLSVAAGGRLVVEVDFSAGANGARTAPRLPEKGRLRVAMEGELAALDVQLEGLRRLHEGRAANPRLASWLLDPAQVKPIENAARLEWARDARLNPEQRACVERALALEEMLLLWGPPGTGKTTVIAEICALATARGWRVLVASQANLAVEQALSRLPATPRVRAAWVSSARRREGRAGEVGTYLRAWLGSVGAAARREADAEQDARWRGVLGEWAGWCENARAEEFSGEDEAFYLGQANVVGATCNEAGKPDFVASPRFASRFDLVVVDEVSKATPPELLPPLLLGRRVMLVGDHRQLPPLFRDEHFETAVENGELAEAEVERFRELVTASWFDSAFRRVPESTRCALRRQYRMHPQIMAAVNLFYADQPLLAGDGEAELARAKAHGLRLRGTTGRAWLRPGQHLAWIDTTRGADGRVAREERVGTSRRNAVEAEACARVLSELASQPESRGLSVAVISFYKAQIGLLRERLRAERLPAEWFDPARDVNTVDQFQGSERDIVIVSLVRADARLTGEFVRDFRRINVAFSRARRLLVVLGAADTFAAAEVRVPGARPGTTETRPAYRRVGEMAVRLGTCVGTDVWAARGNEGKEARG